MANRERRKGAGGELEVARIFAEHFPDAGIERAKRGRQLAADIVRVPGSLVSVKRHEILRLPAWIREADAIGERYGVLPIVAYRTSAGGPVPLWRGDVPLDELARLLAGREALRTLLAGLVERARNDGVPVNVVESWPEVQAARAAL